MDLLQPRPEGLYCPAGDFYVDPWQPVPRAVITHGHGDHARAGMGVYHTSISGLPILQWRLGIQQFYAYEYGEPFQLGRARVSLHPAGHVLGSAQVRIEVGEEVWVVSGDYKRHDDPTCTPFELVQCDVFITECTFGLPVYRWIDTKHITQDIVAWRDHCASRGETAILYCYALGKAQRILAELLPLTRQPALVHGAIASGVDVYRKAGIPMLATETLGDVTRGTDFAGRLILAPPSAAGSAWLRRFRRAQQAFASGWMQIRGNRRRRNVDRGFVISDHVDWPDLIRTIHETGARRVIATHGDASALVRILREEGLQADELTSHYGEDD